MEFRRRQAFRQRHVVSENLSCKSCYLGRGLERGKWERGNQSIESYHSLAHLAHFLRVFATLLAIRRCITAGTGRFGLNFVRTMSWLRFTHPTSLRCNVVYRPFPDRIIPCCLDREHLVKIHVLLRRLGRKSTGVSWAIESHWRRVMSHSTAYASRVSVGLASLSRGVGCGYVEWGGYLQLRPVAREEAAAADEGGDINASQACCQCQLCPRVLRASICRESQCQPPAGRCQTSRASLSRAQRIVRVNDCGCRGNNDGTIVVGTEDQGAGAASMEAAAAAQKGEQAGGCAGLRVAEASVSSAKLRGRPDGEGAARSRNRWALNPPDASEPQRHPLWCL
jgi:hypothetical protein